jgi:hypothetical protein
LVNFLTEDQDGMCKILRVQWTIIPRSAPRPWIKCSGCGGPRPFRFSGKVRLNANGKKLDAWLIYTCAACEKTWNRAIFERRNAHGIDPAVLQALRTGDPEWIRRQAFDIDGLRGKCQRIDATGEADVRKTLLACEGRDCTALEIAAMVPLPASIRLDCLLAAELPLSRSRLQALCAQARLRTIPNRKDTLRRRIIDGLRIVLDLAGEADVDAIRKAAVGASRQAAL